MVTLAIPVAAAFLRPDWATGGEGVLVWLPALVPPFLLAYYRGWYGASLALAGGMAALAVVQVGFEILRLDGPPWPLPFTVVALLVGVSTGSGWIAELLLRERKQAERSALTDALTGLPNRRHASVFLEAAWAAAARGHALAAVMFDLDRFKQVNDTRGHVEGDRVLREVARVIADRTRRMDLTVRFGGEEFLTVLSDCTLEQAQRFAEDVRLRVESMDFGWGGVTLCAGVAAAEEGMGSPDVLVAAADRALYMAKDLGRNQVVCYDPAPPGASVVTAAPGAADDEATDLTGVRVLLVDDDHEALHGTERLLAKLGCRVDAADSPREALALITRDVPLDAIVTDIVMPDMSGFTLVDVASKVRPGLPVLYVSGYPQEEVYWGGTPGARSAFLSKPLDIHDLRDTLVSLLYPDRAAIAPSPTHAADDIPSRGKPHAVEATPRSSATGLGHEEMEMSHAHRAAGTREGRILIVDDDKAIVSTLQRLFVKAGFQRPLGLTDPRRVADQLRDHHIDLVILDLYMPEMDGFQVLGAIAEVIGSEEYLPVLILTGDDDPTVRRRALEAGAMDFLNKPFDPAEAEARVLNLLAARFLNQRVALQRDTLEERVFERTAELADTRSEILHRLARAAEYRDDVTGRHAERVGLLSSRVAAELGLPPKEVDIIRRTAPLHDIGKIGVPDAILYKPGRLTDAEFEIMKSHTTIGAQILGGSTHRLLEVAAGIALCHHERWDGLGYPQGRSAEEIPLEARIVAVVDTFDTITHARPYKGAMAPAAAFEEILRCRGAHYDPQVVDAFTAIRERVGLEELMGLADPLDPSRDTMGSASFEP